MEQGYLVMEDDTSQHGQQAKKRVVLQRPAKMDPPFSTIAISPNNL